jgi:hypothetical protein
MRDRSIMSDLFFSITGAEPKRHVAAPTIRFVLHIRHGEPTRHGEPVEPRPSSVEAIVLRTQIRIEPQWRTYTDAEKPLLRDLFGTPDRWDKTLHALAWADVPVMVPGFTAETQVDVNVPCTYDFDVTASRFFSALESGHIPLRFLFSGSIFRDGGNAFSAERVSWSSECVYRMPHEVWRDTMRVYYGDAAFIRIDRETFAYLQRLRAETGATSWDEVIRQRV